MIRYKLRYKKYSSHQVQLSASYNYLVIMYLYHDLSLQTCHAQATVTMFNYQQFRHISAPGWQLGWSWAKKEVIWSMVGAMATEQGVCSKFKSSPPHCCKKEPNIVDLLPGTPFNQQIANCCKAGVIRTFNQDPANAASSFQISVGLAGNTNRTVKVPKKFTLKAPGPGYTCGRAIVGMPTKFYSSDGRRATQALSKLPIYCSLLLALSCLNILCKCISKLNTS
jgi:hypothetical protein